MKQILATFGLLAITSGAYLQFGPYALMAIGAFVLFEAKNVK